MITYKSTWKQLAVRLFSCFQLNPANYSNPANPFNPANLSNPENPSSQQITNLLFEGPAAGAKP